MNKQETLEEAAKKQDYTLGVEYSAFIEGAKWQQKEKSYTLKQISKEFVGENHYGYFDQFLDYRLNFNGDNLENKKPTFEEWFEQFKK